MEEIMPMVLHGCKLAKDLESSLLATMAAGQQQQQPSLISRSCDEIIRTFSSVKERVDNGMVVVDQGGCYHPHPQMSSAAAVPEIDLSLPELWRSSVTQAMDLFHDMQTTHYMEGSSSTPLRGTAARRGGGGGGDIPVQGTLMEVSADSSGGRGGGGGGFSSHQRHRRSDNAWTERVPAPQYGNTEIPPEDGYTWRKYGQKEILNSMFPRSYYRCTHQKMYNCPAKKQVQRLNDDPYTFEVTYHNEHTCHKSSTAPSAPPPAAAVPQLEIVTQEIMTQTITMQQPSSSTALGTWLSMDLGTAGGSGSGGSSGGGAGPSSSSAGVRYDREGEHPYLNVANMADAMFNSGSSSTNSMEFLFPSVEDHKWQHEEKKN
ncbi:hypothetical protein ACOSQ3_032903 [Xanthoceras sorbifolium]